jgi:putative hydrolase
MSRRDMQLTSGLIYRAVELDLAALPRIDSHLHTSWTDGEGTVGQVYEAAVTSGLKRILYSEHSRKTSVDWFPSFAAEVRALPSESCRAYVGTEVKVESWDGQIDTTNGISDLCDFVMASVHRFVDKNGKTLQFAEVKPDDAVDLELQMALAALENPEVDILGHPFGMSIRRFGVTPSDDKFELLIARAAKFGVAVEVNSHYHNDPWKIIRWCRQYDSLITFGSNAHSIESVGMIARQLKKASHGL